MRPCAIYLERQTTLRHAWFLAFHAHYRIAASSSSHHSTTAQVVFFLSSSRGPPGRYLEQAQVGKHFAAQVNRV